MRDFRIPYTANQVRRIRYEPPFARPPELRVEIVDGFIDYRVTDETADGFTLTTQPGDSRGDGTSQVRFRYEALGPRRLRDRLDAILGD